MKRRNPLHKIKILLEHLESNIHNEKNRDERILQRSFPPQNVFSDILDFCLHRQLIKRIKKPELEQGNYQIDITPDGLEFLEKLRQGERNIEAHKFQRQLVSTSVIVALGVLFNVINGIDFSHQAFFKVIILLAILAITIIILYDFFKRE